jgi:DNA-binding transcriptional LysR family regulator
MKNRAIHNIHSSNKKITGSITISTSATPSLVLLPQAIHEFQKMHPDVKFIVEEKSSTLILEDVCSSASDLGLVGMHVENERFVCRHLFDDELVFICSKELPLDGVVDVSELSDYKFLGRSDQSATRMELERTMIENSIDATQFENVIESDNMNLVFSLVAKGAGISYMSKTIYECYKNILNIKTFQINGLNITRSIHLLTNRRRTLSPAAEDFIKLLCEMKEAYKQ